MKIFDKKVIDKIRDLDKIKPKEFVKIFIRSSSNIEYLYIIFFCKNGKIYIENIDNKFCSNFFWYFKQIRN